MPSANIRITFARLASSARIVRLVARRLSSVRSFVVKISAPFSPEPDTELAPPAEKIALNTGQEPRHQLHPATVNLGPAQNFGDVREVVVRQHCYHEGHGAAAYPPEERAEARRDDPEGGAAMSRRAIEIIKAMEGWRE